MTAVTIKGIPTTTGPAKIDHATGMLKQLFAIAILHSNRSHSLAAFFLDSLAKYVPPDVMMFSPFPLDDSNGSAAETRNSLCRSDPDSTKTKRDRKQTLPGAECAIADAISNAELILTIDERWPEETAIEPHR